MGEKDRVSVHVGEGPEDGGTGTTELKDRLAKCEQEVKSLRKSEEKYRFLVENSKDILWMIDTNGKWQFISHNVERITHYQVKDILGRTIWDFIAPGSLELVRRNIEKRIRGEDVPAYYVDIIAKDGRIIPFELVTTAIRDETGRIIGIEGISREITERKQAEEALRRAYDEMEERVRVRTSELTNAYNTLRVILDTVPVGVIVADAATQRITYYNKNAVAILGGPAIGLDTGLDTRSYELLRPNGTKFPPDGLHLKRSLSRGEYVSNVEVLVRRRDGSEVITLTSSAPVIDENGKVTAAVACMMDITDLKRTEDALKVAKSQSELYLDIMSHDINNMNQVAIGYLELVRNALPGESEPWMLLNKTLGILKSSSELIDNVRKLQRAQWGELSLVDVNLRDILEGIKEDYSRVPGRDVKINISYMQPGEMMVKANQLLKDVFMNLVGNAIKHSPTDRHLRIDVIAERICNARKSYYRIAVEDNGPGIPDALKHKLFARPIKGAAKPGRGGLGLYLTGKLVEYFNGSIHVEDRVRGDWSKGSRFVVILPAAHKKPCESRDTRIA